MKYIILVLLIGCTEASHDDGLYRVTPIASDPAFSFQIQLAIDSWSAVMYCDFPVIIEEDGFPIILVPPREWEYPDKYAGMLTASEILVREFNNPPLRVALIAHELGHLVFGPEHSTNVESIMHAELSIHNPHPSPDDGFNATRELCTSRD